MAAPVYVGSTSVTRISGYNTIVLNKPTGLAEGDLMVVFLASDDLNDTTPQWSTAEAGWTKEGEAGDDVSDVRVAIYTKVAGASEAADYTFDHDGSAYCIGWMLHITGADQSAPVGVSFIETIGGASVSYTDVTTGATPVADCLCLALVAQRGCRSTGFTWSGTGWTERGDVETHTDVAYGTTAGWASLVQSTASAVQTPTATTTVTYSAGMVGAFIAIAPPGDVSKWNEEPKAQLKTLDGIAAANLKAINGVTF